MWNYISINTISCRKCGYSVKKKRTIIFFIVCFVCTLSMAGLAAAEDYTAKAETLQALGLFAGTQDGLELERPATRAEAAVMLVRLLGQENEAQASNLPHPFIDVPEWADCYIGYLYEHNIAKGVSETDFGAEELATATQFATYILRALQFDDTQGEFVWEQAISKMRQLELLTQEETDTLVQLQNLPRQHLVSVSYPNLFAKRQGENTTLLEKLYTVDKAITKEQLRAAASADKNVAAFTNKLGLTALLPSTPALGSEQIFASTHEAIFYIELYAFEEEAFSSGSGFFISPDGLAVTNYHVIEYASSAIIRTADGKTYPIEGVLAASPEKDVAIIQIKGENFPYLTLGDPDLLRIAQRIYCIGSPLGFENTISDGLVSSNNRDYEGHRYIQVSAPIAPGSSGGALLNEFGQVVGITSSGFWVATLNFATPITVMQEAKYFSATRSFSFLKAHSRFDVIPYQPTRYETESSNDETEPQQIHNGETLLGSIAKAREIDRYSFTVTGPKDILVSLTSDPAHSPELQFQIVDTQTSAVVLKSQHYPGEAFSYVLGHIFEAGDYYIEIFAADETKSWSKVAYELYCCLKEVPEQPEYDTFSDLGNLVPEFEPNDTPDYANYICRWSNVVGVLANGEDKDYYSFALDGEEQLGIGILGDFNSSDIQGEVFSAATNQSVGQFAISESGSYLGFHQVLPTGSYYFYLTSKHAGAKSATNSYYFMSYIYD